MLVRTSTKESKTMNLLSLCNLSRTIFNYDLSFSADRINPVKIA